MLSRKQNQAFTLIELLVTIAIISILASILFPVFARARESARRASCLSNTKQLGIGIMQYVQDYDEAYPPSINYGDNNRTWRDVVQPYVKSTQVFLCPSGFNGSTSNGNYGANYSILVFFGSASNPTVNTKSPIKMAEIQAASSVYMVMDYGTYFARVSNLQSADSDTNWNYLPGFGEAGGNCKMAEYSLWGGRVADCQSGRHFGGVNVTFADGHSKWLKSSEVLKEARKANVPSGTVCADSYTGNQTCTQRANGAFNPRNIP